MIRVLDIFRVSRPWPRSPFFLQSHRLFAGGGKPVGEDLLAKWAPDVVHFKKQLPQEESKLADVTENTLLSTDVIFSLPHPIWSPEFVQAVSTTHFVPKTTTDKIARFSVGTMRFAFDVFSGFKFGRVDERRWLNRVVFLETIAGVPGMVGAMVRHLNSLRRMERDFGWIHTLLEEAENERMHLMVALLLRRPGWFFRTNVLVAQGIFLVMYSLAYLTAPKLAHRFVGYLEEEAVITYSKLLLEIDNGNLPLFTHMQAPPVAKVYWQLQNSARLRDVILAIRADESHHRDVNHTFASMKPDATNPFQPGQ